VDKDEEIEDWAYGLAPQQSMGIVGIGPVRNCADAAEGCYDPVYAPLVWSLCCATCNSTFVELETAAESEVEVATCEGHGDCGDGMVCGNDYVCYACSECTSCSFGIDGTCGTCVEPADGPCTTYAPVACGSCPIFEGKNCSTVPAGETCTPTLGIRPDGKLAECLSGTFPDLTCPEDNYVAGRIPQIFDSMPDYICSVCKATLSVDSNTDPFVYTGILSFGPNQKDTAINEDMIKEYRVYWVDAETGTLGTLLNTVDVQRSTSGNTDCCEDSKYQVSFSDLALPSDAATWHLAVVPVEDFGGGEYFEMVTGVIVEIFDVLPPTSTTTSASATTISTTDVTTTPETTYVISISMEMSFGTPEAAAAAAADPQVKAGVEQGIAVSSGVGVENKDWVEASLTVTRRRLKKVLLRSFQFGAVRSSGGVAVSATITIPSDAPATISADAVANTLSNADTDSLTSALSEAIASVADATYTVAVTSSPTVAVVAITATTTSTTSKTTTTSTATTTTKTTSTSTTTTSTTTTTSITTSTVTTSTTTTLSARAGAATGEADWKAQPSVLLGLVLAVLLAHNLEF
jgi:hypothetical protein